MSTGLSFESYAEDVDRAAESLLGVPYSALLEIAPGLDKDSQLLRMGHKDPVSPLRFVTAFSRMHNLSSVNLGWPNVDTLRPLYAGLNRWKAMLVSFAAEADWRMGTDGHAYKAEHGTTWRMEVCSASRPRDENARPGPRFFLARLAEDAELSLPAALTDPLQRVRPPREAFDYVGSGMDIDDALVFMQPRPAPASKPGFGKHGLT